MVLCGISCGVLAQGFVQSFAVLEFHVVLCDVFKMILKWFSKKGFQNDLEKKCIDLQRLLENDFRGFEGLRGRSFWPTN